MKKEGGWGSFVFGNCREGRGKSREGGEEGDESEVVG